jgi:hypothetical protein
VRSAAPPASATSEATPAEPDDDDRGVARELSDEVLPTEIYGGSLR